MWLLLLWFTGSIGWVVGCVVLGLLFGNGFIVGCGDWVVFTFWEMLGIGVGGMGVVDLGFGEGLW